MIQFKYIWKTNGEKKMKRIYRIVMLCWFVIGIGLIFSIMFLGKCNFTVVYAKIFLISAPFITIFTACVTHKKK